jgi:DNA repair protein RecN (Recombination protein N)
LEKQIAQLEKELSNAAKQISQQRSAKKEDLEKAVQKVLKKLAMPDAELRIEISNKDKLSLTGIDTVNYLFKTNLGGAFSPIKKTASGGELSRLMLALMSILSKNKDLPTLIFDEIDTGVSGEVAAKIATEFEEMGKKIQVIAITHLAQVAGRGTEHLHVSKHKNETKTTTKVNVLNKDERINVLAQMISGEKITNIARENAIQLLKNS